MEEEEADLEAQLASKEKEWKDLQARCIQQLETALRDNRAQLSALKERFQQLQEDFQYNLRVLDERDRELERYDAMAARLQTTESARQAESSELRIQINKLQDAVAGESRTREEMQRQYQQRLAEHRLELDRVQSVKDCDVQKHREDYETLKRELERKIAEVEGELALQKQELMAEFDGEMKRREHEFNLRADEMSNTVLSHELKVKLLSKELEAHAQAHAQAANALQACEEDCRQAHKEIQRRDWEIKDITAVKDARIKELEDKLSAVELNREKEEEVYRRKHEELDRCWREREGAVGALKEAHSEQLRQVEARSRELQAELDVMLAEKRRMEWSHTDALRERDELLEKLRDELETTRAGWDTHIAQVSRDTVSKDVELQTLGEREARLREELQRSQEDVERYKQQVTAGVQREKALEQIRVQVELDWQRRLEDQQASHYLKSEELIQGLSQGRDQALAELRERERELQEVNTVLRSVTLERDQALQRDPDAQGPSAPGPDSFPSEEIQRLQQQNSNLRSAIANMRRDMESLSEQLPTAPPEQKHSPAGVPDSAGAAGAEEYCRALQDELKELKAQYRLLQNQLEETIRAPAPAPTPDPVAAPTLPISPDNVYLQNHIRSLNETIGGLRAEKVSSAASLKRQEVRLVHLESTVSQFTQQIHAKQVECDELRFELANQKKRAAGEEAGLRQRLAAVEMELEGVRREAEEYQRGSLLQNLEAVALGNQVSALKLDIASGREPIVVEQSAALRQLQEENLRLRQQLLVQDCGDRRASEPLLRSKLKQAVRCIAQLTQDKLRLIEMGNRLRSQLARAGLDDAQLSGPVQRPVSALENVDSAQDQNRTELQQSRLSALEQLQYKLTTQALQYAQLDNQRKAARSRLSRSGTSGSAGSVNPWDQYGRMGATREPHSRDKKENTPPRVAQSGAGEQPELGRPSIPSQALLSSVGTDESLGEVWGILERGSDLSASTPEGAFGGERGRTKGTNQDQRSQAPASEVTVLGSKMAVQERRKPATSHAETARKPKAQGKTSKIRNYNIKD